MAAALQPQAASQQACYLLPTERACSIQVTALLQPLLTRSYYQQEPPAVAEFCPRALPVQGCSRPSTWPSMWAA